MRIILSSFIFIACATSPLATGPQASALSNSQPLASESHFASLRQLTFEGENAEAYWNFRGTGVSMQRRGVADACDKIFKMDVFAADATIQPVTTQLSSGQGATTCAHYTADDARIIYASTHGQSPECPKKPDMSQGYVWALYDSYDIFSMKPDGTDVQQLTNSKGYDAEATVCAKDGSIIFTSVRDGDIDLYRMDSDGQHIKRLTKGLGYDGGAFFSRDCSKIVWRASRPKPGQETTDYQALLAKGLVRPSKLELMVANADGSQAHQVTNLGAASFAPFFFPDSKRILFSSNYGDARGREFDVFAIDVDGTHLERITSAPGFDGFPMFSPDGKWLMFSSNRATAPGRRDTNLFLAEWKAGVGEMISSPADATKNDVEFLADEKREGRGLGSAGLEASAAFIESRFQALSLTPLSGQSFRSEFQVETSRAVKTLELAVEKNKITGAAPFGFSKEGQVTGELVFAEYGIQEPALGLDDYKGLSVKDKVVLVRRFAPGSVTKTEDQRRLGDLRKKAFVAKSLGAKAMLVVDLGDEKESAEASFPVLRADSDSGLVAVIAPRKASADLLIEVKKKKRLGVKIEVAFERRFQSTSNILGRIKGTDSQLAPLVIGAHYDHLGFGGPNSLQPDSHVVHPGADDNASGVAILLSIAGKIAKQPLARDVIVVAFSGEEEGVLGSAALLKTHPELSHAHAMLNLDMVGRLRETLAVLGVESAAQWRSLVEPVCIDNRIACSLGGDGYGPSDHMSFYVAGVPVLHFCTGTHGDYHKPSDVAERVNATGLEQVAEVVTQIARAAAQSAMTFQKSTGAPSMGDSRSFGASLGTVPNYASTVKGVLLDDVRAQSAAEKAGLKKGDVLVKLGADDIGSVHDLMFVLQKSKPSERVKAVVQREGKRLEFDVTFGTSTRH
jgi:Tol biopolymer transport system component